MGVLREAAMVLLLWGRLGGGRLPLVVRAGAHGGQVGLGALGFHLLLNLFWICPILHAAPWAGIVVLPLQLAVAEEAHLVPTFMQHPLSCLSMALMSTYIKLLLKSNLGGV